MPVDFGGQSPLEGIQAMNFLMLGEEKGSPVRVMPCFFSEEYYCLPTVYMLYRENVDKGERNAKDPFFFCTVYRCFYSVG